MSVFGPVGPRVVRTSQACDKSLSQLSSRYDRFDEVYREIRRKLAHVPQGGKRVNEGPAVFAMTNPALSEFNIPAIVVLYGYDAQNLFLIDIRIADDQS